MSDFFPRGFWPVMAMFWMVVFLLFGVDLLLFRAKLVNSLGRFVNKSIHLDQVVLRMLDNFKKASDSQIMGENALLGGWGRLAAGGVLITASLLVYKLIPVLK